MERIWGWIASRYWVPAWAIASCAVRILLVVHFGGAMRFSDEIDYDRIAMSIIEGKGFGHDGIPTGFRPPGQPFFLAAVYAVVGHRVLVAELIQAVALSILPFLVARVATRVGCGIVTAHLAAALSSLHPALAYASATLYPTVLTTIMLTWGVTLAIEAIMDDNAQRGLGAGAALGIAGLATTYLAVFPILAGFVAWSKGKLRVAIAVAAIGMLPALAWSARNSYALGTSLLSTNGSVNLALGANDRASPRSGNWIDPDPVVCTTEKSCDDAYRANAMRWIQNHPTQYATLVVGRTIASVDSVGKPVTNGPHRHAIAQLSGWLLLPWTILGIAGLVRARKHYGAWLVALALCVIVGAEALTIVKPRFRFPCDPLLGVFAMMVVATWLAKRWPSICSIPER